MPPSPRLPLAQRKLGAYRSGCATLLFTTWTWPRHAPCAAVPSTLRASLFRHQCSQMAQPPSSATYLDAEDWQQLGQHLVQRDEDREAVIKRSRDAQKLAKQAIFSVHRGDHAKASDQLAGAEAVLHELLPLVQKEPALRYGSYSAAAEEWVEGSVLLGYIQEGFVTPSSMLDLADIEEYLGGVLDFTGELNRYAVMRATARDKATVQRCRDVVEAIMGQFLQFDLRNSALRKKYDGLKYTLNKLEKVLYELTLTESTGLKLAADDGQEAQPPEDKGEHGDL